MRFLESFQKRSIVRPRFAIALPVIAVLATIAVFVCTIWSPHLSGAFRAVADIWVAVNAPAKIFELASWPMISDVFGVNFGINLDSTMFGIGVALLWLGIGHLIDLRNPDSATSVCARPNKESKLGLLYASRVLLIMALAIVETTLSLAAFTRLRTGTLLLRSSKEQAFGALTELSCGLLFLGWMILLILGAFRYFAVWSRFVQQVLRVRTKSSWRPYLPTGIALVLLITIDGRVLLLGVLFVVTVLQVHYRSVAGWAVLLMWFVHYSLLAVISTIQSKGDYTVQLVFLLCGLVPTVSLLLWHPRFDIDAEFQVKH